MNVTFNQIKVFVTVANKMSITLAAEQLHLSQPAVSIQLKNFQDQFKIPIYEIINKKFTPTPFGLEILEQCKEILSQVELMEQKSAAYSGLLKGRLKVSAVSTAKYVIPFFVSAFAKTHDSINLEIDVTNKSSVIKSLERNTTDFAIVSILPEKMSLNHIELMDNELYLFAHHEVEEKGKAIFKKHPLIFREKGSATRDAMEKHLSENKISVGVKYELSSNEAVKQAVMANLGCSIMPLIGAKDELNRGTIKIVPQKGLPIKSKWYIVWRKDKRLSPLSTAFITYLQEHKEAVIADCF
jgi:DNA-binding transcriptional LysR family regulator